MIHRRSLSLAKRQMSTITRTLPMPQLTLKEQDPELYAMLE